ncbi:MAG: hypothetical protein ACK55W_15345, partial [Pseudomonadota bacterium]
MLPLAAAKGAGWRTARGWCWSGSRACPGRENRPWPRISRARAAGRASPSRTHAAPAARATAAAITRARSRESVLPASTVAQPSVRLTRAASSAARNAARLSIGDQRQSGNIARRISSRQARRRPS